MNGLSHAQAQALILATLDGLLDEAERAQLTTHLADCEACRAYQSELSRLETALRQTGQSKLENLTVPPAAQLNIQSTHRKNLMKLRTINVVQGLAILALVAFGLTLLIPQMKQVGQAVTPTPTSQPIPLPQTLAIDPGICKPFDDPSFTVERPPLGGFQLIQGAELKQDGFSYKFWLYCNPAHAPEGTKYLSSVAGLGLYASWKYTGAEVTGSNAEYFGFEPDIRLTTRWNGTLSGPHGAMQTGIILPAEVIRQNIQARTPIQYRIMSSSPLGKNGAVFSFTLEPTEKGLVVTSLNAAPYIEKPETNTLAPADRLVAYASSESGNAEIYLTRTDGGPSVNITNHPAYDSNPVWSPDGRKIAFESERDGNREIYVMDFDGSNVIRLTNDPANDVLSTQQAWSPDGTHILYKNDNAGKWDLFVASLDGSNQVQLTQESDTDPEYYYWSPDSQKVAYITGWSTNKPRIQIANADGMSRQALPLPKGPFSFSFVSWAADSQSVYYSASDCSGEGCLPLTTYLYQNASDGNEPVIVASGPAEVLNWLVEPGRTIYLANERKFMSTDNRGFDHWNWWQVRDGKASKLSEWLNLQENCQQPELNRLQISLNSYGINEFHGAGQDMAVAIYCGKDDQSWLYRVSADGSKVALLNATAIAGRVDMPRLSADGKVLLYDVYNQQGLSGSYALNIPAAEHDPATSPVRLAATNAQAQPVPFAEALSVNPASVTESTPTAQNPSQFSQKDWIVFVRSEGAQSALYVMKKDGSGQRRLTNAEIGSIFNPQWSPDGTQILFEGWNGSAGSLYLVGLDGNLKKLAEASGPAAWLPDGGRIAYMTQAELRVVGRDGQTLASAPLSKFAGEADYWSILTLNWTPDGQAVQTLRTNNQGSYPLGKSERWWVYEMDAATGEVRTAVTSELPIVTWYGDLVIVRDEKSWLWQRNGKVISTATPGNCATLDFGPTSIGANWSPDGKWVLFAVDCAGQGNSNLYLARADGSDLRLAAQAAHADWWQPIGWSPDDRYIIFGADLDAPGNYDIYLLHLNIPNSKPVRLTNSGFSELTPSWQP